MGGFVKDYKIGVQDEGQPDDNEQLYEVADSEPMGLTLCLAWFILAKLCLTKVPIRLVKRRIENELA